MTLADAITRLRFATSAATDPAVSDEELEDVLGWTALADSDGRSPEDAEWERTHDFLLAEAMVYERKAALLANQVTFSADGSRFDLNARVDRFRAMAEAARGRRFASVPVDVEVLAEELESEGGPYVEL
jgi:hypothetical protein